MLVNRQVILAEVEATYNVDPTPTGADNAIEVENLRIVALEGLRMVERPSVRASIGTRQQIYGGAMRAVSFDFELRGSGAAGTPPEASPILRAAGLSETIAAGVSVTYAPVSTGHESMTLYGHQEEDTTGVRHIITGIRGSIAFRWEAGQRGMATFTGHGHLVGEADVANVTPVYDTTRPPVFLSAGFDVGGFAAVINALAIGLNNQLSTAPSANAADGYGDVQVTKRDVAGSFDPEAELLAVFDPFTALRNGTTLAVQTGVLGATAGNRYQVTAPAAYYRDVTEGDRDGVMVYDLPVGFAEVAGDDEFSLVFT